jgi:ABC-type nitrate/sulfonate/bicarbonate transport system substrate-binding protein
LCLSFSAVGSTSVATLPEPCAKSFTESEIHAYPIVIRRALTATAIIAPMRSETLLQPPHFYNLHKSSQYVVHRGKAMSVNHLWYTRCPVPTAFSVALRLGWIDDEFAPDQIKIESLLNSAKRTTRESHFAHTQPNSFRHGGNIPPLWAFGQGSDVRLIALSWNDAVQVVLTRADSDIRTLAELKGRKLALPCRLHDSIDFWRATVLRGYHSALRIAGLTERDVEFVEIPIARAWLDDAPSQTAHRGSLWGATSTRSFQREEALALLTGKVDAIFSAHAHAADIKAFLGARVLVDLGKRPDRLLRVNNATPLALTVSGALVEQRPDLVARWLANVIEAAHWAKRHREETVRIVAAECGVAEEIALEAFGEHLPDQLSPDLSDDKVGALVSQKEFLLNHGFISKDFDIDKFIVRETLAEANRIVSDPSRLSRSRYLRDSRDQPALALAGNKALNTASTVASGTRWPAFGD